MGDLVRVVCIHIVCIQVEQAAAMGVPMTQANAAVCTAMELDLPTTACQMRLMTTLALKLMQVRYAH